MRLKLAFVMPMVLVWLAACDRAQETPPSSPSSLRQQAPLNANCSSPTAIDLVREIVTEAVETEVRAANKGLPENRRLDLSKVRALAGEIQFELLDVLTAKNDPNSTPVKTPRRLSLVSTLAGFGRAYSGLIQLLILSPLPPGEG